MNRWFNQVPVFQQTTRLHSDNYSEIGVYVRQYLVTVYENDWKVAEFPSSKFYTKEDFKKEFSKRASFTKNISLYTALRIVETNLPDFGEVLLEAINRASSVSTSDSPKKHILGVLEFVEENEDGTYSLKDILPF